MAFLGDDVFDKLAAQEEPRGPMVPSSDLFPAFDSGVNDYTPPFTTSASKPDGLETVLDILSLDTAGAGAGPANVHPEPTPAPPPAGELFGTYYALPRSAPFGSDLGSGQASSAAPAPFRPPLPPTSFDHHGNNTTPAVSMPMSVPQPPTKHAVQLASSSQASDMPKNDAPPVPLGDEAILQQRVPKKPRSRRTKLTPEEREARRKQRLILRRQRKSVREKARRSKENDYYEELADLVGLPKENRDKATILMAVIKAIEEEGGEASAEMLESAAQARAERSAASKPQTQSEFPSHIPDVMSPMDWDHPTAIKDEMMAFDEVEELAQINDDALPPPLLAPPMPTTADDLPPPVSF
ncbi:Hypothetical Protein FCC1311_070382 [Hondaea fermentalgiana]|uniref:BHLH domain-containing protein n=1 Tax=Hondaea fermentalgiana TaxID=2315210 RepID=A0A2R5GM58_9STRA|nr:Hypothetical Protein FCC1311_070382 [Hondaea fermentalgiana]|eukprot:GBG30818.1 Hypothetical Protein FCC1311_070382 [Hondaea fermentalgiana]